jgi:hypothetical protein
MSFYGGAGTKAYRRKLIYRHVFPMIFDFVPGIEFDDRLKFNRIGAKLRR